MSDADGPDPTPRYRRVLENSAEVARGMGHSYVGVEHLFLAIFRQKRSFRGFRGGTPSAFGLPR